MIEIFIVLRRHYLRHNNSNMASKRWPFSRRQVKTKLVGRIIEKGNHQSRRNIYLPNLVDHARDKDSYTSPNENWRFIVFFPILLLVYLWFLSISIVRSVNIKNVFEEQPYKLTYEVTRHVFFLWGCTKEITLTCHKNTSEHEGTYHRCFSIHKPKNIVWKRERTFKSDL